MTAEVSPVKSPRVGSYYVDACLGIDVPPVNTSRDGITAAFMEVGGVDRAEPLRQPGPVTWRLWVDGSFSDAQRRRVWSIATAIADKEDA